MKALPEVIITHAGRCHADEVGAVSIMHMIDRAIPVYRRNSVSATEIQDDKTMVLDIGRVHDPMRLNYDHHHDRNLPATCSLVWGDYGLQLLTALYPNFDYSQLLKMQMDMHSQFWNYISDVDTGKVKTQYGVSSISTVIAQMAATEDMNSDQIFWSAVDFMDTAMMACIASLAQDVRTRERYDSLPLYEGGRLAVNDSEVEIPSWKEWAKKEDGPWFMVHPSNRGGYLLVSQDSDRFPILQAHAHRVATDYVHNALFLSQHPDLDSAMEMGKAMIKLHSK